VWKSRKRGVYAGLYIILLNVVSTVNSESLTPHNTGIGSSNVLDLEDKMIMAMAFA